VFHSNTAASAREYDALHNWIVVVKVQAVPQKAVTIDGGGTEYVSSCRAQQGKEGRLVELRTTTAAHTKLLGAKPRAHDPVKRRQYVQLGCM